ncbi:lipoprotein [Bacteriovorax sp. PP10]|uniref:Type IV secretion system putative lipoprotein virB7 n=1 Tax=Bacteriovorax antarcticus TaxID=3088717 RepID=A0ABU5VTU1_9BACT|nr:lipoprotein [Bacteriovorax sp. PP10]MEA9356027.1 lipoprotein [Bacteriovorax sp. PP10]
MKKILILLFILLTLASCSQGKKAKGSFKLILGNSVATPMNGGAYVETEDNNSLKKTLIKLDAENSALIPLGTYNMLFVTFTGPGEHLGSMYCGSVTNAPFTSAATTVSVSISTAQCSESKYSELITKIIGNSNSNWDSAKFDQGKWGQ